MFKRIFHTKHIFDPCIEIKITFLHISKYNIKRKLFPFKKSVLISFTLKKHSKSWRIYSSPNIISYTTFIIDYLSRYKFDNTKNILFSIRDLN